MPSPLIQAALDAQAHAYAPYSHYNVGAAIEDEQGRIHPGCNVENVSFGGTICAERAAITRMIADGGKEIRQIAVVTKDGGAPCGICRQVLAEFAPDPTKVEIFIVRAGEPEAPTTITLAELLPFAFKSSQVARTDA
jgi:cytidine deaminase